MHTIKSMGSSFVLEPTDSKKNRLYGQKQMKCCSKIIIFCVWQKKVSQTDLDQLSKTRSENKIKLLISVACQGNISHFELVKLNSTTTT